MESSKPGRRHMNNDVDSDSEKKNKSRKSSASHVSRHVRQRKVAEGKTDGHRRMRRRHDTDDESSYTDSGKETAGNQAVTYSQSKKMQDIVEARSLTMLVTQILIIYSNSPVKAETTDQFESRRYRKDIDDHGSREARKKRAAEHGRPSAGVQESKSRSVGLVEGERRRECESRGHRNYHGSREDWKREDNSVLQKLGDKRPLEDHVNEDKYGSRRYSKDEHSYDDAKRRRYEDSRQHRKQDRYDHRSTEDAGRHRR